MKRLNISSGAKWESLVGYSRAVRIGNQIYVSGTTPFSEDGRIIGIGDPYAQTIQTIKNIEHALQKAETSLQDVVRTRIYVTDINNWQEIGRAHSFFFKEIKPATTMIEVSRLIEPEILVEIEALAILEEKK
jgi:enamine deaminase RidA (YjgF/YER057c/UK114 family)